MRLLFPEVGPPAGTHDPIRWRDRGLWALLAVALAMQLFALSRVDGYQIADAVEYMDRANMYANGEAFDPRTPRPFTFSGLLSPLFRAAKALELNTFLPILAIVRTLQILVGLAAVWVTARIGARLGGRSFGLVAGAFLAANIAFMRYSVTAVADPEAMLFMAMGVEAIVAGRSNRHGLLAGLWLGTAILFAYKSAPMTGFLLMALFARERLTPWRWWLSLSAGMLLCLTIGASADALVYGRFGSSIDGYIQVNVVSIVGRVLVLSGFGDAGRAFYNKFSGAEVIDQVKALGDPRSLSPESWYFENMHLEFLAWPLLALLALGMLTALRRLRHPYTTFLFVSVASYALLSNKGFKDFRLFFPIVPMVSVLGALGWRSLRGDASVAPGGNLLRVVGASGLVVMGFVLAPARLQDLNLRKHSGYWRAIEVVNAGAAEERAELAERGLPAPPRQVGSAYHWAVSLRQSRDVELRRLPMEMVTFVTRSDRDKYAPVREALLEDIASFDWFIAHMQLLWQSREIMEVVNANFEIHALLYDAEDYAGMAPICVLRRRRAPAGQLDAPRARTFFDVFEDVAPQAVADYRGALAHPVGLPFRRELQAGEFQELELLGWDTETGLGDGDLIWVTYHWYARTSGVEDFAILDRFTDPDGGAGLLGLEYHRPAYAAHDTSTWKAGMILRESYPRMMPARARSFGGASRRGDLIPGALWMAIQRSRPGEPGFAPMLPWNESEDRAYGTQRENPDGTPAGAGADVFQGHFEGRDGRLWDREGRIHIGGDWLPVPSAMRVPDDGQPLP